MQKEKPKKLEQKIKKLKIDGKSPRIVIGKADQDKQISLIQSTKKEPAISNLIKSYVLMIERYINQLEGNDKEHWIEFLEDLKSFFDRETKNEDLKIIHLHKYVRAHGKEFKINGTGNIVRISKMEPNSIPDFDLPLANLRFIFISLCTQKGVRILKTIMVCKICKKLYANRRQSVCSDKCNSDFQNKKKSSTRFFSTYNRKSDNKSVKKIK